VSQISQIRKLPSIVEAHSPGSCILRVLVLLLQVPENHALMNRPVASSTKISTALLHLIEATEEQIDSVNLEVANLTSIVETSPQVSPLSKRRLLDKVAHTHKRVHEVGDAIADVLTKIARFHESEPAAAAQFAQPYQKLLQSRSLLSAFGTRLAEHLRALQESAGSVASFPSSSPRSMQVPSLSPLPFLAAPEPGQQSLVRPSSPHSLQTEQAINRLVQQYKTESSILESMGFRDALLNSYLLTNTRGDIQLVADWLAEHNYGTEGS